ncbi:McrB family protein [Flavobacterium sp.]|uniref:McrB family protein n=1 Tax=Flavobacterium sp. TaxID=239 RepID=UPI00391BE20C
MTDIQIKFRDWLTVNFTKSADKYFSYFNTANKISINAELGDLYKWTAIEWSSNESQLRENKDFIEINAKGHNNLTASIGQFKKFLRMEIKNIVIPPVIPFPEFKWRWAVTTPSESLNTEELLFGVLAILVKHNGKRHATQEFKNDLLELQNRTGTSIDLAKIDRDINKNIIENSGQYWKALGLLNSTTDGTISVTDLGKGIVSGNISKLDFIKKLYNDFSLPNPNIESISTISIWNDNNIVVHPFKIIFNILLGLSKRNQSPTNWYIEGEELRDVVIPLSIYKDLDVDVYVDNILKYRADKSQFSTWPNCAPGDNDFRMIKEYLLFLSNFGFLDLVELKDKSKRYYINSLTLSILDETVSLKKEDIIIKNMGTEKFDYKAYLKSLNESKLTFSDLLIIRFISSLSSKPFVILSGLSGSGKTKIAQSFVQWICEDDTQYKIVPVGADWTNREPLVGYPNGLVSNEYITPDSGVIHLLMEAVKIENENKPFFLILDEMNLSHVERYFADFLSIMESNDSIKLYTGKERSSLDGIQIPLEIGWPKNVFIIGTVNIDETTYMFSPKVLDRANVIEFRITEEEINGFLASPGIPVLKKLKGQGIAMAKSFLSISEKVDIVKNKALTDELVYFFNELKKVGAEFGYRSATEIMQLAAKLKMLEPEISDNVCLDIAIMQKLLPKLHGSRSKLVKILIALAGLCIDGMKKEDFEKNFEELYKKDFEGIDLKYSISFEKLIRMYKNVLANGFTSYAEA